MQRSTNCDFFAGFVIDLVAHQDSRKSADFSTRDVAVSTLALRGAGRLQPPPDWAEQQAPRRRPAGPHR
jgi:hypothetical protein